MSACRVKMNMMKIKTLAASAVVALAVATAGCGSQMDMGRLGSRSEEHTSELQSQR